MKLSIFTILMPEHTLEEICEFTASLGCAGIELRVRDLSEEERKGPFGFWGKHKADIGVKNLGSLAPEIRKTADKYKLEIPAVASYCMANEHADIEEIAKHLGTLGCKNFRVRPPWYDRAKHDYNELFKETAADFAKTEKVCRKYGVKALIETHMNSITPSAGLTMRLAEKFDPEYIGVIHDPGNMVYEGYENYLLGLQLIGKRLSHVHIKNSRWVLKDISRDGFAQWKAEACSLKAGAVDYKQFMADLKKIGYNGWFSCEDFSEGDPKTKLLNWVTDMKSLVI
ncbi:MAG: sugar phosphate isomerase/epimerase family protein [Candidatus Firestonebacteria bacterium]